MSLFKSLIKPLLFTSLVLVSISKLTIAAEGKLPEKVVWITNDKEPTWASPKAKKGGTLSSYIRVFPLTLRFVGPDSNGGLRRYIWDNRYVPLVDFHPNTGKFIPLAATHWAFGKDGKTVYYKLDKDARWSDGKPITADDYVFALEFMRSKHIVAPWYNNHYTKEVKNLVKYDDYTIAITGANVLSRMRLLYNYGVTALPKHAIKLDKNFVKKYNWKIIPTSGAYQIDEVKKGKSISFKRIKNWWGENKRYFKNRLNVDKILFKVIRDESIAFKHFEKGRLDAFGLTQPDYWHEKSKGEDYQKGYIHKYWVYTQNPQPDWYFYLNKAHPILADKNVRLGIQHSINVDKVLKTILRGDYLRQHTNDHGKGKYTNKKIKARSYDPKKADSFFKKAGWEKRGADGIRVKDGKRLSFTITTGRKNLKDRLVIIVEEAKKVGLELKLKILDGASAWKALLEKQHEIAFSGWGAFPLPQYYGIWHSENANKKQTNNMTNTSNPELDKKIEAYKSVKTEKEKIKLSHEIQKMIFDDAAYIPLWLAPYHRLGFWAWLKFPEFPATKVSDGLGADLFSLKDVFWIDQEEKKAIKKARKKKQKYKNGLTVKVFDKYKEI